MSDEIKEILDKAKEISGYGSDGKQHTRMFNQFEAKALLDYITNLQKIEREYSSLLSENAELQQENDRLNEENKKFNKLIETLNKENHRLNEYNHLQSKIDKAIEYINNNLTTSSILDGKKNYCLNDYSFNYEELLDILKVE